MKTVSHLTKALSVVGLCTVSISLFANNSGWHFEAVKTDVNSGFHFRLPQPFKDDVLAGQVKAIKLTKADIQQADSWGLDSSEEKRYIAIMSNRGAHYFKPYTLKTHIGEMLVSSNYTPVEVLGVSARTNQERQKYAKQQAEDEFQWIAKYLAYNSAYHKASVALKEKLNLPIIKKFNTNQFSPYNYKPVLLQANDKLLLFVRMTDVVRPIVASLMNSISVDKSIKLNIYFVGKHVNRESIQDWARSQNLISDMVSQHQITLNYAKNRFTALNLKQPPPALLLIRNGKSKLVDLGRF